MATNKMHVRKNDMVMITTGKDRGKTGKVQRVFPEKGRLIVESLNIVKRHTRPRAGQGGGGIVEKEAAIQASNVMLVCPGCAKPTRTGKRLLDDGSKARFCKKCNEIVDK
ncbi:50S ribosomal protein L24 [Geoalkalibacter halelectricus]|uniref:Large ribosomal subunit protein uL24 n=1 Tax=Geoalkalibacter halelectricus TaxID=2847045 RepID=A0ABY5ZIK3_9BACT|nr:50S ribosomal protein L24 [Geoalkalibacter halelectricus]MDO3379086.1 50S ribosomal protein L24 [Geoalkalibacter halelectricus]UWZ78973.1 50S ribosomal protein L24 [Geoalkalibacter halelectricus]